MKTLKTFCLATLAALMGLVSVLAGPASAEDELGFNTMSIRFAGFGGGEAHEMCVFSILAKDEQFCCPTWTTNLVFELQVEDIPGDGSILWYSSVECKPRDVADVADADS